VNGSSREKRRERCKSSFAAFAPKFNTVSLYISRSPGGLHKKSTYAAPPMLRLLTPEALPLELLTCRFVGDDRLARASARPQNKNVHPQTPNPSCARAIDSQAQKISAHLISCMFALSPSPCTVPGLVRHEGTQFSEHDRML